MDLVIDTSELSLLAQQSAGAGVVVAAELSTVMTRAVIQIEGDAKRVVPVDTGNLRRSLTHEVTADGGGAVGTVGTNVRYARPVEFGTYKMKAQPYLGPAFTKNRAAIEREFSGIMAKVVRRLWGG